MSSEAIELPSAFAALGVDPRLCAAVEARGFVAPTPVQAAVLAPELAGRDLLVTSQTGSGKTAAFGLLLGPTLVEPASPRTARACTPRALVVAPTRELATQVREELAWLLAPLKARVLSLTGGTSVVGDLRALSHGA